MENNKTPSIRFKGFTDPWEQRKFGDIVDKYEDPVETPHNGYYRLGIRSHAKGTFHSFVEKGHELETAKMHRVAANNFIVNITFGWEHAVAITDENDDGKLVSHRFPQYSFHEGMVPQFFKYVIADEDFRHWLWLASPGGAGRNRVLKLDEMLNYEVIFPSKAEQLKIGNYFKNLDNLITLHQRKYDKLQNIKKSMLEKMFPKNGSNVPEIRFSGFTDPWEQRKVFEIADRFDNLRVPVAANLRISGNTPYYGANGIQDYVEGYTHDGEYILVAEDGASDLKNYPVNYVNGRIWVNNHAHVLQGKEKIANNKFLSYAMRLADIESVLVGGGRAKLNADIMMNLDIAIPSFNEQEQIGAYFSNLDNLITLHQRELEKLQNIKKSMLEKMFV